MERPRGATSQVAEMAIPVEAAAASWVVDLESELGNVESSTAASAASRRSASIYRVPSWMRDHNASDYTPRVVSFGPIHHGSDCLMAMEEHKRRALAHFLTRANKSMADIAAPVEGAAAELMDSYEGLDERWRRDRESFLKLMIIDGCFMLELFLCAAPEPSSGRYGDDDPVFGSKGRAYVMRRVSRDLLLIENQLPLLLLHKLAHSAFQDRYNVHELVLGFFHGRFLTVPILPAETPENGDPPAGCLNGGAQGLHVLDVYRKSMLLVGSFSGGLVPFSASGLRDHGVRFLAARTGSFRGITFDARMGILRLPAVVVDDDSAPIFLNLVAFERLHHAAGNEVNNYLALMGDLIHSVGDVVTLGGSRIIHRMPAMSYESIFRVFERICKGATVVVGEGDHEDPRRMESDVSAYCKGMYARITFLCRRCELNPGPTVLLAILAFYICCAAFRPN